MNFHCTNWLVEYIIFIKKSSGAGYPFGTLITMGINKGGIVMCKKLFCNVCGRQLHMENNILLEDAFEAKKQWGYFSKKDATLHSFVICENCYDEMVDKFVIPPEIITVTEL